jgi:hypothetical protein
MLWPRLSPERSCVCCRSRRRLGRLRARPASHCNLDRVVFRYQNERRSRVLAASSCCATGIDLFGNPASPVFSPAPGPIRTARNGLSAVGRCGHGPTSRLPRRTLWVRFRLQSGVQGRGPLGLQYVDSGRLLRANCGHSARAWRTGKVDPKRAFLFGLGTEEKRQGAVRHRGRSVGRSP